MTKQEKQATSKKTAPKKEVEKKYTLIDLVKTSKIKTYIIIGALSYSGLLEQYNKEMEDYGIYPIKPSITKTQFENIIKKFNGD